MDKPDKSNESRALQPQRSEPPTLFEQIALFAGWAGGALIVAAIVWFIVRHGYALAPTIMVAAGVVLVGLWAAVHPGRKVMTVAGKELRSYFVSPLAYVILGFYLGVCGLIFALTVTAPYAQAEMAGMFHTIIFVTLMMAPVLTMGLISQEQASGSIELLMTNPVRDVEVVLGKYVAAVALFGIVLVATLEFPLILEKFGEPDWGAILAGYIGVLLAGMAFIAVGLFASSLTSNQIASAVLGTLMLLFFWLIGWLGYSVSQGVGDVARYLSVYENFQDFAKGIIDTRPLVFFASLTFFALMLTVRTLENRRLV
jgi:ABC-2 type transport system permease protein